MKLFRSLAAAVLVALSAACSDSATMLLPEAPASVAASGRPSSAYLLEPVVVVAPQCDPYTQLDFSCAEDDCAMSTLSGELQATSGCMPDPGGSGGPGTRPPAEDPFVEGPILFGQCFVTLLGVLAGTAAMLPTTDGIYGAAREVDSAKRMLQVVIENNGDAHTQALWEFRVETAENRYNDAVGSFAIAAGFTAIAVGGAAVACLPAALLPTP